MPRRVRNEMNGAGWILRIAVVMMPILLLVTSAGIGFAQSSPLTIFKNYFVTGDYIVSGWVEQSSAVGFASGVINIPDQTQPNYLIAAAVGPTRVPIGADIVAAYLYWGTVEGSQSSFAGQKAIFNGYSVVGTILGNPNSPVSWSSGGCTGSSTGSKTIRMYRADVRPYLPLDQNPASSTFGALVANGAIPVSLADSGSNGNTQPNALGASLVVIYRILNDTPQNSPIPLNAIILYDGSYAPSNTAMAMSLTMSGFYQPGIPFGTSPVAKITHIVANGQPNKGETVSFGSQALTILPSLYKNDPPFPGLYGGAWDNPTWNVGGLVNGSLEGFDTQETTQVVPTASNSGCVNWGAIVLSTTVQDSDRDGLLDVWESSGAYTDAVSGQQVSLPQANPSVKDLFVEIDYLSSRDGSGNVMHSHLPKRQALDNVAQAFSAQGINVHFDVGSVYQGDPNVISGGTGGNEISESSLLCSDISALLCAFPNQPAVGWKGGFIATQSDPMLGNFQAGRAQSYHYVLFGHSLGAPRSYWSTLGTQLQDPTITQLVSIVDTGNTATVTIKSPPGTLKPGDCQAVPAPAACSDANSNRITISGALIAPFIPGTNQQPVPPLNGSYNFRNAVSGAADNDGVVTTTFQITTSGVIDGKYQFSCTTQTSPACAAEPQLGISYLGPTSTSGHSDFGGGGDSAITLGLWRADNAAGCQPDPSVSATAYCDDQVGTLNVQTGTLMHELGHTLTFTHGGTYYKDPSNRSLPFYELNCKPNDITVMNYLFQARGFTDGGFDFSSQTLPPLNETTSVVNGILPLSESTGLGPDVFGQPAQHLTRWYASPNAGDLMLHDQAIAHCDGTPLLPNEFPGQPGQMSRVDAFVAPNGNFSSPLDWNNNLTVPDPVRSPGIDLNFNGLTNDAPFSGFNEWQILNDASSVALQQIGARENGFGFSGGGGTKSTAGGTKSTAGGIDNDGGGTKVTAGGTKSTAGGTKFTAGGTEQDTDTANSTANAPTGLICTNSLTMTNGTLVPGCTLSSGLSLEKFKAVPLTWSAPGFGQIRKYDVWRAVGTFTTTQQVLANINQFSNIATVTTPTPPSTSYIDNNLKNGTTYTYFVTSRNIQGAQSGPSTPLVVAVKF
jgi:hypothetical protein